MILIRGAYRCFMKQSNPSLSSARWLPRTLFNSKKSYAWPLGEYLIHSFVGKWHDCNSLCSGRYNIDMYQDFLRLRGKTYDYKILYSNIIKLFLLLKPDEMHVMFVVSASCLNGIWVINMLRWTCLVDWFGSSSSTRSNEVSLPCVPICAWWRNWHWIESRWVSVESELLLWSRSLTRIYTMQWSNQWQVWKQAPKALWCSYIRGGQHRIPCPYQ